MIPERLLPVAEQIASEYASGETYGTLTERYHCSNITLGAVLDAQGTEKRKRGTTGGRSRGYIMPEVATIPCPNGVEVEGAPRPCVVYDIASCASCLSQYSAVDLSMMMGGRRVVEEKEMVA